MTAIEADRVLSLTETLVPPLALHYRYLNDAGLDYLVITMVINNRWNAVNHLKKKFAAN